MLKNEVADIKIHKTMNTVTEKLSGNTSRTALT